MTDVSIIIPVHNAAATLAATLKSLGAQSESRWEAIVVDDGSSDDTSAIAAAFAKADRRIRILRQSQRGAGAARNSGLAKARGEWVIFLDADDRLVPDHLCKMLNAARRQQDVDLFHCGWRRLINGRGWRDPHPAVHMASPFAEASRYCPFAIHSAMIRRRLLVGIGGFDPSLKICEDWDLWQRLARSGARFAPVRNLWAEVHVRPNSLSSDTARHLSDGLIVIRRGHEADARVRAPLPDHASGEPDYTLWPAIWTFALWIAGAAIGRRENPIALLESVGQLVSPNIELAVMATVLEDGIAVGASREGQFWADLWPDVADGTEAVLRWLDGHMPIPMAGRRIGHMLEDRIAAQLSTDCAATIGRLRLEPVDASQPFTDLVLPGVDRVRVSVRVGETEFGQFERILFGGLTGQTLMDIIANDMDTPDFRWALLSERVRQPEFWERIGDYIPPSDQHLFRLSSEHPQEADIRQWGAPLMPYANLDDVLLRVRPAGDAAVAAEGRIDAILAEERKRHALADRAPAVAGRQWPTGHAFSAEAYWEAVFDTADPWDYRNGYEATKYAQTLDLIRGLQIGSALEIACAEGEFSRQLAPLVGHLLATDIAPTAITRAQATSKGIANLAFARLDLLTEEPPETYDLIVCSEVLYYVPDRTALAAFADKVARHLRPGGWLVMAHGNLLVDEPDATGFGWPHAFGAKGIGEVFAAQGELQLSAESRAPLYRIQRFRKVAPETPVPLPEHRIVDMARNLPARVASQAKWRGGKDLEPASKWHDFPILMYHRIAEDGPADLARFRLSPARFEEQLAFLREAGWQGISMDRCLAVVCDRENLPERSIMLTFDDATSDFMDAALPLLHRYGFPATVFVPAGKVGGAADWDSGYGEPAPLLAWDDLRILRYCDVTLGAHGVSHSPLTALAPEQALRELAGSRFDIEGRTGQDVISLAYPYGDYNLDIRALAATCGYRIGLTCFDGFVNLQSDPLALPRIEISGDMQLDWFRRRIGDG